MTDDRRREVGEGDAPVEDEIEESFDAVVDEGAERLQRTMRVVLATGFAGGLEVGLGVMGYLAVLHETDSHLLAGLAFSVGLIALHLAHSELFTENFLMPIVALIAREGTVGQLLRLWLGTLLSNLAGGWVVMWLVVHAFPQWHTVLEESARHYVDTPFGLQAVVLAVLGGSTITLMTRMQQGTDSDPAKLVAAVVGGFLLAGLQLFHSILDSLLVFGAIQAGASITYGQWLGWFGYTLLFNVLGGVVLVTSLRIVRSADLLQGRRRTAPDAPDRAAGEQG
ncbi:formate/nitrite transporter family protein [Curtobacterium caseinilyticum]|uniref:Formate/nitrite transporter family protein n=1 Tax=Curtobacterium caseinilyticum TaxID=3055137 RepID=A0ABT7TQW7_9MICO|nr:formate/nitrite transporter family protein [Curtobacterium caseinilyticum]MDM7891287.1 formate/nitrite transporter family protein [Curtobacterium caseinilyticum]